MSYVLSRVLRRLLVPAIVGAVAAGSTAVAAEGLSDGTVAKLTAPDRIASLLAEEGRERIPVIVEFRMPAIPDASQAGGAKAADAAHKAAVHRAQDEIFGRVFDEAGPSAGAAAEDAGIKRMKFSPMFAATVDRETLEKLAADPAVVRIHEDSLSKPMLDESVPLIGMPTAWAGGATGNGWHVAVLDTGARRTHKFLASKVVEAACYSTNDLIDPELPITSLCPDGVEESVDIDSANDCDPTEVAGCGHGTHVSGIVAGFNSNALEGEPASGVARSADLISINVFSKVERGAADLRSPSQSSVLIPEPVRYWLLSHASDQIRGLERVYELRNDYDIAAVNLSLAGSGDRIRAAAASEEYCDDDSRKHIIDMLYEAGIVTVVSAGDSYQRGVAAPACISTAVAVAASTAGDEITLYSSWGPEVDLVAPGGTSPDEGAPDGILSSHISEMLMPFGSAGSQAAADSVFRELYGTSLAAAHVSGAFAALKSAVPFVTIDQIEEALESTGTAITHEPIGWNFSDQSLSRAAEAITRPRINVAAALTALKNLGQPAEMVSPEPGSTLTSWYAEFSWTAGANVSEYWLYVGNTGSGSAGIFDQSIGSGTSVTVGGIPSFGDIYVRLWSRIGERWHYRDYVYDQERGDPELVLPKPETRIGSTVQFDWTGGVGANRYWLYVGTEGPGSADILDRNTGDQTFATVRGLPSTGTINVRLWWLVEEGWRFTDYSYQAGGENEVVMTTPAPGEEIGYATTFEWTEGSDVAEYWLYVGSDGQGSANIFDQSTGVRTSAWVPPILQDATWPGRIDVRLWWRKIGSSWQYRDYVYGVDSFAGTKAVMNSPLPGETLGTAATFVWRGLPEGLVRTKEYWLYVGSEGVGSADIYNASTGTSRTARVEGLPADGTIYVRLWSLPELGEPEWRYADYTYSGGGVTRAAIMKPLQGQYLGTSATFEWTAGADVDEYWLYVGTEGVGSADIHNESTGKDTSTEVTALPGSGTTLYVRLWSKIGGRWYHNDYRYEERDFDAGARHSPEASVNALAGAASEE